MSANQPKAPEPEFLDDGTLTVVYRGIASGDEAGAVIKHPKMVASSWSHAMNDRDRFLVEAQRAIAERDSLRAKVERLRSALTIIASWDEGPEVNSGFDEPESAKVAREALK